MVLQLLVCGYGADGAAATVDGVGGVVISDVTVTVAVAVTCGVAVCVYGDVRVDVNTWCSIVDVDDGVVDVYVGTVIADRVDGVVIVGVVVDVVVCGVVVVYGVVYICA